MADLEHLPDNVARKGWQEGTYSGLNIRWMIEDDHTVYLEPNYWGKFTTHEKVNILEKRWFDQMLTEYAEQFKDMMKEVKI